MKWYVRGTGEFSSMSLSMYSVHTTYAPCIYQFNFIITEITSPHEALEHTHTHKYSTTHTDTHTLRLTTNCGEIGPHVRIHACPQVKNEFGPYYVDVAHWPKAIVNADPFQQTSETNTRLACNLYRFHHGFIIKFILPILSLFVNHKNHLQVHFIQQKAKAFYTILLNPIFLRFYH